MVLNNTLETYQQLNLRSNLESDYEPKFEEKAIEKDVVNPLDEV